MCWDENMSDNYTQSVLLNDLHQTGKSSGQTAHKTETGFMLLCSLVTTLAEALPENCTKTW